jgi:hypothetical protein
MKTVQTFTLKYFFVNLLVFYYFVVIYYLLMLFLNKNSNKNCLIKKIFYSKKLKLRQNGWK